MKQTFLVPALLLLHLSVLAINPSREYTMTPASFQLTYTEHRLATSDSAELAVWVLEPDTDVKSPYTFIIAGSDAGNMGYSLPYAFYLLQQGIRVITFDYRGFGASSDFAHRADYLLHEEYITDMETVLEWVNAQDFSGKTGVLAFSMGTWIARAAYPVQPFDAFVAEGLILRPELVIEQIHAAKNEQLLLPDNYAADRIATLSWPIPTLVFASRAD
ncbi:MAG: alpha/beta fold hydrolase, partial [Phaeodactylibacter sp.]|nr:alpha/beta fold hydrolase [Phaeodactylibacter sp.]